VKRGLVAVCALTCALLAFSWLTPLRATDGPAQLVNAERVKRGIPALAIDSQLNSCAERHSQAMATKQSIWHDLSQTAYSCAGAWVAYGENVGMGPSVDAVHQAFMNSPEHRRNILEPVFTRIGTGTAWNGDTVYVTEIFVTRPKTSAPRKITPRAKVFIRHPLRRVMKRHRRPAQRAPSVTVSMLLRLLSLSDNS
jgi:Cysteine-rich secretory protein family